MLEWVLNAIVREGVIIGPHRAFKNEVLHLLITLFSSLDSPDYFSITQCFVYLDDPSLASQLLSNLLALGDDSTTSTAKDSVSAEDKVLIAFQIAFDLAETAGQGFLEIVRNSLSGPAEVAEEGAVVAVKEGKELNRQRVVAILTGEESIRLYLEFLYRNNHADLLILKGTKVSCRLSPLLALPLLTDIHMITGCSRSEKFDLSFGGDVYERFRQRRNDIRSILERKSRLARQGVELVQVLSDGRVRSDS